MNSPMDKFTHSQVSNNQMNMQQILNQARQNPRAFEEQIRRNNPQVYEQALKIRNTFANPQEAIMQIAQRKGINPNIIKMLNL